MEPQLKARLHTPGVLTPGKPLGHLRVLFISDLENRADNTMNLDSGQEKDTSESVHRVHRLLTLQIKGRVPSLSSATEHGR
eukprot:2687332-Pleurochrysis_carterae.AAC.1